jgi:hypothetical protein
MPTTQATPLTKAKAKRTQPSQPSSVHARTDSPISKVFVDPDGKPYKFYIKNLFPNWDEDARKQLEDGIKVCTCTNYLVYSPKYNSFPARKTVDKSFRKSLERASSSLIPLLNGRSISVHLIKYFRSVMILSAFHVAGLSTGNLSMTPSSLGGWRNRRFKDVGSPLSVTSLETMRKVVRHF